MKHLSEYTLPELISIMKDLNSLQSEVLGDKESTNAKVALKKVEFEINNHYDFIANTDDKKKNKKEPGTYAICVSKGSKSNHLTIGKSYRVSRISEYSFKIKNDNGFSKNYKNSTKMFRLEVVE